MKSRILALAAAVLLAPLVAAAQPLQVVASFSILADIATQVGGPDVAVRSLVGPDGDAHEYEPTPADARKLAAAQVLVVNGLDFEAWLPRLQKAAGFAGRTVVASKGVEPRRLDDAHEEHEAHGDHDDRHHDHDHGHHGEHGHHHGDLDPHAWQDLANGAIYARNIARAFAEADPAHAQAYRQRADAYVARIEALDQRVRQLFEAIEPARRKVVSSHDAFGYFGQAYGVRFIALAGVSTDAEPSAADMARIIEQVRRESVPAVFVENIANPRLAQQLTRETQARLGGTLYSDALARPGEPAGTYLGMFEWNAQQLAAALRP
ncbi:periplasmic solute-binding family protein [Bordetella bronchiseptica CA90 BB1334]|uniref:metal ABC transporter substrate-binding protein n=1 Tax=Bordetella bronchiseptica TaxID=518 RepID=UPI000459751D|nr:metal ABC transporter substrate-binding protein [Bordetella bronchiseptica]KCV59775.1 periplasmic solute-binding family protein [Bordetella bronchiseptica 99-R-0433]KDB78788.1 periplasmic solute-binding family protein [Bordetella bronchiseptica CA90 BB1334]KDD43460.1 periplasmic solute-binding family protein [Bordetella bronchiseptica OSU095]